ncbi:terminase large subunit [Paraburkholderia xenovorans]|uniref:terminase large subunit n=1 Tax=Paraburkholderia xenovorans TaxID=36873 RepID=UPI0015C54AFD|nr:terminase TerL endonuclease subunit [Paraburkholderia xenovorans]NPT36243.1 phage terminase small subunit P27 family [Paraburkholderia xenovorans]
MTTTRKTRSPSSSADPVTAYAKQVVAGKRIAGPHVRNQCARHLRDLAEGKARGLVWKIEEAAKAIRFYKAILKLNGGDFEGVPFELLPWQQFVVGSLFGWYGVDGYRRFRVAYVETAKGSGKSPLAAGVGMKGLVADGEARAEIYAAATKKDQAMILFRDAVAMHDQSPELSKRLTKSGTGEKAWNLAYLQTGSFFRPISSDDGQSGPRPHIALVDELHEHKTNTVIEMMRAGTKSRRQALIFMITNSGSNKTGPCWGYHQYGARVAAGDAVDDAFFPYICALDEEDDPFKDEKCWPKANPSLQDADLPGYKYIREQVTEAKGMPSKEALVRRLNFCQWTDAESPWISHEVWKGAQESFEWTELRGRRALAGLDLSSTTDLTGLVFFVEPLSRDEPWKIVPFAWLPEADLQRKADNDKVPYVEWKAEGLLETTPGRAISKRMVLQRLSALCDFFEVIAVAYDRWRIEDLIALANDEGITLPEMKPFGQGYKDMSPAVEKFETMLLNGEVVHPGHKVLTWCAGNSVIEADAAENRKLSKDKASGRIDLMVAAVMAAGMVDSVPDDGDVDGFFDNPIMVGV